MKEMVLFQQADRRIGVVETLTCAPARPRAEFHSEDGLLNAIWNAAAETTRLYITNGCAPGDPVRERVHWFGDDGISMRMAFYCFGEWRTWRRALELLAEAQHADGCFPVISPGHFEDFNMVSGSCSWIIHVRDYVAHTGDTAFAEEMLGHVERAIAYELRYADQDGLLYETPGRRFLSWADGEPGRPYTPGETWRKTTRKSWGDFFDPPTLGYNAMINAWWLWALREAAALARSLGRQDQAAYWDGIGAAARPAYERLFRDPETGLYRDNVAFNPAGKMNAPSFCESTLFLLIRAGLLEQDDAMRLLDRIWQPDFICCRSSGGLELGWIPPFLMEAGRTQQAIALWKDRWGEPVKAGATTCGEEFFQGTGNSDCHIHGASPARDFIEYLAGIRLSDAMWSKILFAPPADGPDLECSVPTPQGTIRVALATESGGRRVCRYAFPAECEAWFRTSRGTERLTRPDGVVVLGDSPGKTPS